MQNENLRCSIAGCASPRKARGWCDRHCSAFYRTGSPTGGKSVPRHGLTHMREYGIWKGMNDRCFNPNRPEYKHYGGAGLTVCDRWRHSFPNFLEDMGVCPIFRGEIDRIDNLQGYEPGNCRWATRSQQMINRNITGRNQTGYRGVSRRRTSGTYYIQVTVDGVCIWMGGIDSAEYAANLYDQIAGQLHGQFAHLNFEYE